VGDGWRVALATLAFERGVALLGHQLTFRRELEHLIEVAGDGRADPVLRQRLARAYAELSIMRWNSLRSRAGIDGPVAPPEASIAKLFWGSWHRRLGELAMDVLGPRSQVLAGDPYELDDFQRTFLFSRAETIYGGSDQIQRNIIGERVLGLPQEPRPQENRPGEARSRVTEGTGKGTP
jgi:alkylation response protein AidB-like acyl-CoA dehydrogenase